MNDKKTRAVIDAASQVAIATTATAATVLAPHAAIPIAAGAAMVTAVTGHLLDQQLSDRQRERLTDSITAIKTELEVLMNKGMTPREGLLQGDWKKSAEAELLEGCLLHGRDAYESLRKRHLDHFWARWAFSPAISPEAAVHLFSVAKETTYRQWCLLALAHETKRGTVPRQVEAHILTRQEQTVLVQEVRRLRTLGLANLNFLHVGNHDCGSAAQALYFLLALEKLDKDHVDGAYAQFRGSLNNNKTKLVKLR